GAARDRGRSVLSGHTEHAFESAIEAGLVERGGYAKLDNTAYDEGLALFPGEVTAFLQESQPTRWSQLRSILGARTEATVLDNLAKELETKGSLHVLRHGFKCYGKLLRLAFFRPNT